MSTLEKLRKRAAGGVGWIGVLPGWGLLVLAVWWPQSLASTGALWLGVVLGLAATAAWVGVMVVVGFNVKRGLFGAAFGVVEIAMMHGFGTGEFQAALALSSGRTLDGVTLAEALAQRDGGLWVRLTDARVRSDATEDLTFTSGGGRDAKGGVRATTTDYVSVAPIVLASSVPHEDPMFRADPVGEVVLWACAGDSFMLSDWDRQRQAVRGRMLPMEDHVRDALAKELAPTRTAAIPGAGAIPAAPGATDPPPPRPPVAGMWLPVEPWCIHLDRALDAAAAREQAVGTTLAIGASVPLFVVLFAFLVARSRP